MSKERTQKHICHNYICIVKLHLRYHTMLNYNVHCILEFLIIKIFLFVLLLFLMNILNASHYYRTKNL